MKKYLYLIKNSKIPTYLKYWLMYSSKKISLLIQSLPITLENTIKDLKIVINKIYGNSEQNTTTGKNLLPPLDSGSLNGLTFTTNSNGITTISGTTTGITNYFKNVNKILPAGTYTLSINLSYTPPTSSSQLILQDINNVRLATINLWKITSKTFTLSADTEIKNYYLFSNSGIQHNGTISIQLEEGSTATSYEPYTGGIPSPNPDYPQEITNVTGDVEVIVGNKNLFDETQLLQAEGWTVSNGIYSGIIDNWFAKFKNGFTGLSFETNTQYTISLKGCTTGGTPRIKVVYMDGTSSILVINATSMTEYSLTSTFGKTVSSIQADFGSGSAQTLSLTKFQIEQGSTATTYTPHQEQTFTFPLGNEKLMLGDYLADDGIHHVRGQVVFDGSENWLANGESTDYGQYVYLLNTKAYGTTNLISDKFLTKRGNDGNYISGRDANKYIAISIAKNIVTYGANQFKTWLSTHNVTVEYELEEEVIVPYTSAQQEVYNQIKQAISYEGQTNISSNQNIYLDIDYIKRG